MLRLVCGNLNYSSWSVRPWLALKHSGLDFRLHDIGLRTEAGWKQRILSFSGAGKVPVLAVVQEEGLEQLEPLPLLLELRSRFRFHK